MKHLLTPGLCLALVPALAGNLQIKHPTLYVEQDAAYVVVSVSWDDAWYTDKSHDAAWIFLKLQQADQPGSTHLPLLPEGHSIIDPTGELNLTLSVANDGSGAFFHPRQIFYGDVSATLKLRVPIAAVNNLPAMRTVVKAYGMEMVYIEQGDFFVGDADTSALAYGALYQPNAQGAFDGPARIAREDKSLTVAPGGDLYYRSPSRQHYEGDQTGIIPPTFPKGVQAFWMMKYEIQEGNYAAFLNALSAEQAKARFPGTEEGYYEGGGTLTLSEGEYQSTDPTRPSRWLSWDDAMAFADWAGLRPMTEFEYTKAARGRGQVLPKEYPWGATEKVFVQRITTGDFQLVMQNGWDEGELSDEHAVFFGASYYWVFDLSGSVWERVVSIGHPTGRAFTGTHGDGVLDEQGLANVDTWPTGDPQGGGVGFRGGGYYGNDRSYHEFNPYSPIAYRPYGGWHGTMRSIAYGTRLVRTADK